MKLRMIISALVICTFLTGCLTLLQGLLPKVTPEQISIVMAKADAVKLKSPKRLNKSGKQAMKIKKGQWITTLTRFKTGDGDVTLNTTRIISIKGTTVVMETETYAASKDGVRTISQMTIENYPVKPKLSYTDQEYQTFLGNMRITRVVSKTGNEPPQEVPEHMLSMAQGMVKGVVGANVRLGEMRATSCNTQYLKSSRCYDYNFSASVFGMTMSGVVTSNSAVPINGLVRIDSNQMTEETIAFGYRGAKAAL